MGKKHVVNMFDWELQAGIIVDTSNELHLSWKVEIRNINGKTSVYFDVLVIILRVAKKEFVEK